MRARASLFIAMAIACVDLFHDTNVCDFDVDAAICTDAATDVVTPPNLCASDAGEARATATHACAWLAACDHPIGQNMTGACMVNALLAYDCEANPNRKPLGAAQTFWECMQNASSCGAVEQCVFPQGIPAGCKNGGFLGCSQTTDNTATRFDCVEAIDSAPPGENCAAYGRTCDSLDPDAANNKALCVGPEARNCTATSGCVGTQLSVCDDAGIDRGYDCASFGAGACSSSGASAACVPGGSGTCASTNDVTCTSGNVQAKGCVAGIPESVDCTNITGAGSCVGIEGGAPGTIPADACRVADAGCATDTCNDASLVACVRGLSVAIDCASLGLKSCAPVTTEEGNIPACTPP